MVSKSGSGISFPPAMSWPERSDTCFIAQKTVRLNEPGTQVRDGTDYRVSTLDADWRVARREPVGDWLDQYHFSLEPCRLSEFAAMSSYHQTSLASHFTQRRVCTCRTAEGQVTLTDDRLIVTGAGGRRESPVDGEEAFRKALADRFGIEYPPTD